MPIALDKSQKITVILPTDKHAENPITFKYYYPNLKRQRDITRHLANFESMDTDTLEARFDDAAKMVQVGLAQIDNMPEGITPKDVIESLNVQECSYILSTVRSALPDIEDKKKSE